MVLAPRTFWDDFSKFPVRQWKQWVVPIVNMLMNVVFYKEIISLIFNNIFLVPFFAI